MEENNGKPGDYFLRLQSTYYYFFKDSPTAMAIADRWGIIEESNNRFKELVKSLSSISPDVSSNSSRMDSTFDFLPINDAIRFSNLLSRLANDEADTMDYKTPYRDKNGNIHWFRIRAWKMNMDPRIDLSGRGNFIGFLMNDETMETEAEEKLQEDMRVAEKAMEAKSRFLAAMSHEIRTPIQTIIGMTECLEDTSLNKEQSDFTRQIQFSADLLLSIVNDILDYSKIEAGKMEVERIPFNPALVIEQSVKMLSQEIEKKGLKLFFNLDPGAGKNILGDPGKFRQVIINLAKNAVKFTPKGSITISAAVALGDAHNRTITVAVADTGIGIPKEGQEQLFTTFMQVDSSHTRRFGGTGLGLAISHNLVELMGGTIEMFPNRGGGSVFRFTIPAEEPEPNAEIAACENADDNTQNQNVLALADIIVPAEKQESIVTDDFFSPVDDSPHVEPPRVMPLHVMPLPVMIVEDHEVNRHLFVMILEKLGIRIIQARDGLEALEKARPELDIIFMDIHMPRMNGFDAAAELRKRGFTMPLVAVTASVLEEEQKQCLEAGFNDVLRKPFKRPDIEAMFRKWSRQVSPEYQASPAQQDGPAQTAGLHKPDMQKESAADSGSSGIIHKKRSPVFCREELLDTFMQNQESVRKLLKNYLLRSAAQLETLPALTEKENWTEAHRVVHSIKGSARTLSAMELGNAAEVLETACKQKDTRVIESSMPSLMEAFNNFKNEAEDFLRS